MSQSYTKALSVLLPIRNEQRYIINTLTQIIDQSLPPKDWELIVVDGVSNDRTKELVLEFCSLHPQLDIQVLDNQKLLSSAARNIGVRNSRGEFLLVLDGHVEIPSPTLFEDCLSEAKKHSARCLGRPQPLDPKNINAFQRLVHLARQSKLAHSLESHIYSNQSQWVSPLSVGVMYHQSVFDEIGLFDERFDAAEDLEFNYRAEQAGIRCLFSPKFAVKYYPRESLKSLFRQLARYGNGRAMFVLKHPMRASVEVFLPAVLIIILLTAVISVVIGGWVTVLGGIVLVAYAGSLLLDTFVRLPELGFAEKLTITGIIATIHCGLGYGFIRGLIGNSRSIYSKVPTEPAR